MPNEKLRLQDLELKGKKVLMRVDFNVPLDEKQKIRDDTRITTSLPSIQYVLEKGGSLVLISHLGRPKSPQKAFSLAPCAQRLAELLKKPVKMASDCIGTEVEHLVKNLQPGEVLLLENLRFHEGEKHPEKDPGFAKQLSRFGDFYVNDAFGNSHRRHSSGVEVPKYFPNKAAAGFLIQKEVDFFNKILLSPKKPFYALIGGSKISSKIGVLKSLIQKVDLLFVAGAMAFTFLKAKGISIGDSLCEEEWVPTAKEMVDSYSQKLVFPIDAVATPQVKKDPECRVFTFNLGGIPKGFQGADIGPQTIKQFCEQMKNAKTIFWNGPVGIFENPPFEKGTFAIARSLADSSATTIIGGGDSIAAINTLGIGQKMTHISTGGGASLEFIENGTLPAIEALSNK